MYREEKIEYDAPFEVEHGVELANGKIVCFTADIHYNPPRYMGDDDVEPAVITLIDNFDCVVDDVGTDWEMLSSQEQDQIYNIAQVKAYELIDHQAELAGDDDE